MPYLVLTLNIEWTTVHLRRSEFVSCGAVHQLVSLVAADICHFVLRLVLCFRYLRWSGTILSVPMVPVYRCLLWKRFHDTLEVCLVSFDNVVLGIGTWDTVPHPRESSSCRTRARFHHDDRLN